MSLRVLGNLNATDLFLASGVWKDLAADEVLWHSLCTSNWGYASIYNSLPLQMPIDSSGHPIDSYKRLYLLLDEATVTFNADAFLGMNYLFNNSLVENSPSEIAKFFYYSRRLRRSQIRMYIQSNATILDHLVRLDNCANMSLCSALRKYFGRVIGSSSSEVSSDLDANLHILIDKFASHFCECNPSLGLNQNSVYILCYSLLLLSTDLSSPHIKNKMSKREFIRNVRHALDKIDDDLYGQLYDDVYLGGHVAFIQAGTSKTKSNNTSNLNNGSNSHLFIYVSNNQQASGYMVH